MRPQALPEPAVLVPSSLPSQQHLRYQLDGDLGSSSASLRLHSPVPSPRAPAARSPPPWQCLPPSLVLTSLRWCSRIFTFFSLASSSPLPGAFSTMAPLCWTRTGCGGDPQGFCGGCAQGQLSQFPSHDLPHPLRTLRSPAGHTGTN